MVFEKGGRHVREVCHIDDCGMVHSLRTWYVQQVNIFCRGKKGVFLAESGIDVSSSAAQL